MNLREFVRFHLLKVLVAFVVLQIAVLAIIQNFNHRPLTQPDTVLLIEDRSVKINPLFNDTDENEEDELRLLSFSNPLHGTIKQKENLLYYTPVKAYIGADSLTYTITDGRKKSKPAIITINVNENLKPLVNKDIAKAYYGDDVRIEVLKNDIDREEDSIFILGYSAPRHGNLRQDGSEFIYTAGSFTQIDSFHYVVSDGKNTSDSVSVVIHVMSKSHSCYPWYYSDVGDASKSGSFDCSEKTIFVESSGSDIWNKTDGFGFVYQYIKGDCEIYAKVESLDASQEWAKAGLMIRESLTSSSKCVFVAVTKENGAITQYRKLDNEFTESGEQNIDIKAPYWLKLTRKDSTFNFFVSNNGEKWDSLDRIDVSMNRKVYVGPAFTSHNNNENGKAIFSNFKLVGTVAKP